jgi:ABC-2 type transport system ATP-binding protein
VVFGFLGPNGAGKTTTIRLLLNLIEPTSGSAEVLGFDTRTHGHEIRSRCGSLLEHSGLYERLSAEDNLRFYGRVAHMTERDIDCRIEELLTRMGLWDRRKETVVKWSRGMKQKLALARGFMRERPLLLVLDEPTAALDAETEHALFERFAEAARSTGEHNGRVTILVSHRFSTVRMADLIVVLDGARVVEVGTHDDLMARGGQYSELFTIQAAAYR